MKLAFTLCSNNYLAQSKVLVASFLQNNPDYTFIIGVADNLSFEIDYSFFLPAKIIAVTEIPNVSFNIFVIVCFSHAIVITIFH